MSGGSGEEAIISAAAAQVVNAMGLPSSTAAGMADSKIVDAQAGHEKANAITLAANAGANVIHESAGMLASLLGCSLEALVVDNDMLGSIMRTVRGIEITPETLSLDVIRDVVHGPGHYLGHGQTLGIMQTEYIYPEVGDRLSPDDWVDAGATTVSERAHERVSQILAEHHPDHIDPAVDDLEEAYLFNIDDLSKVMEEGRRAREVAAQEAERLVAEEADRFVHSLKTVDIHDDLAGMNAVAEAIRVQELSRSTKLTRGGVEPME